MKFYFDTEFWERPGTMELISIGIVAETGEELYLENSSMSYNKIKRDKWLRNNVLKYLEFNGSFPKDYFHLESMLGNTKGICPYFMIGDRIEDFVYTTIEKHFPGSVVYTGGDSLAPFAAGNLPVKVEDVLRPIQFLAYYADYDWVNFCWTFGRMIDLPKGFPMYCYDLKQKMDDIGLTKEWKRKYCPDPEGKHNALVDAKWNMKFNRKMNNILIEREKCLKKL